MTSNSRRRGDGVVFSIGDTVIITDAYAPTEDFSIEYIIGGFQSYGDAILVSDHGWKLSHGATEESRAVGEEFIGKRGWNHSLVGLAHCVDENDI